MNNHSQSTNPQSKLKAVGLISGGLDSSLAVKVIQNLGIQVYGIFFDMPWRHNNIDVIKKLAQQLEISLNIFELDDDYLEMVKKPLFGRGTALNPCMDCHIYMIQKAGKYMDEIHADFVFTGEVLGQRPMSQNRSSLNLVERKSGLKGKLLRPMSAGLMEPIDLEKDGIIDRTKLLSISGRGRREQLDLAKKFELQHFAQPAGGCLLTDRFFSKRLEDLYTYGYRNQDDIILLKWARHFRIKDSCKFIISKNEWEEKRLIEHAHPDDYLLEYPDNIPGPTVLVQCKNADNETLALAAGYLQYFSKYRSTPPQKVTYRLKSQNNDIKTIEALPISVEKIDSTWIR